MASIMPQTPQKPLPGAFLNTPAFNRQQSQGGSVRPSIFQNSNIQQTPGIAQTPPAQSQYLIQPRTNAPNGVVSASANTLSAIESAARTMNAALEKEKRYPPLDNYISRKPTKTLSTFLKLTCEQKAYRLPMTSPHPPHGLLSKR